MCDNNYPCDFGADYVYCKLRSLRLPNKRVDGANILKKKILNLLFDCRTTDKISKLSRKGIKSMILYTCGYFESGVAEEAVCQTLGYIFPYKLRLDGRKVIVTWQ